MPGTLYLVATPIGNLEDITLRALRVLREQVQAIACEDTRQTQKLLQHFEIRKPLLSYHEHNEESRTVEIMQLLANGESVALVSDAGTPLLSDPGYRVVHASIENGFSVVPLPGASAALAALAASGLPTHDFRFIGFLPAKSAARRKALQSLADEGSTVIAYETPHRISETLADISEILGTRAVVLARELTKIHEEFLRGTAAEVLEKLQQRGTVRGEITLLIGPGEGITDAEDPLEEIGRLQTETGLNRIEAIKAVAKRMKIPKRELYRRAVEQDNSRQGKNRD